MKFKETTKKAIIKVMEILDAELYEYEWGSDEADALGDILCELDDLRRSSHD